MTTLSKRVLITGAAGFIGFHVAQALKSRGDAAIGLDNFNAYYSPQLKQARATLLKQQGISIEIGDLLNRSLLQQMIKEHAITHIVHLAAQAGVRYSLEEPHAYIQANIEGFLNILELCRTHPHIPLIYASSSSVYGLNQKVPFALEDRTDAQASLYGVTKKTNELMAQTYHHLFGIHAIGLRFFTVYGPWGRPDMAYFSFTRAILENRPIEIYNHGKMKRDFTYIDDIVEGVLAALDLAPSQGIFNLGNHQPVELLYFVELLEKALGKTAKKVLRPMQAGDVVATYADIEESQQILGFNPKVSLEEGIPRFVKWYCDYYQEKCDQPMINHTLRS